MSWDEMGRHDYPCPCGAGTYTVVRLMDDWNRSDERWSMNCPPCLEQYAPYETTYRDSGMWASDYHWVPRGKLEALTKCEDDREDLRKRILGAARGRHLAAWRSLFSTCRTKKAAWLVLTAGKGYPSLSTFYSHLRTSSLTSYIDEEFNWRNLPGILSRLETTDLELDTLLAEATVMDERCRDLEDNLTRRV